MSDRAEVAAVRFYAGRVFHARLRPHPHRFFYRVLSMVIDVGRLDAADRASRFFSVGRFNLLGFYPADHGAGDGGDLGAHVRSLLIAAGVAEAPRRIELMCFPRLFGFVFNPISVFYCHGAAGLIALVYEVRNTFGEKHSYVAPVTLADDGGAAAHERDKLFYVSPFMDMPLRYRFRTGAPGAALSLKIIERDASGVVLTALLAGEALPPGNGPLLRAALGQPLLGFKVVAGIHWEALRLWLKGHGVRPRPAPPAPVSFNQPGAYSAAATAATQERQA